MFNQLIITRMDTQVRYSTIFALHMFCRLVLYQSSVDSNSAMSSGTTNTPISSSSPGGPTADNLRQMADQLAQWRGMLPSELQWNENDPASYPSATPVQNRKLDPSPSSPNRPSGPPMFTADLDDDPAPYKYAYDIQVALLRTRYYYAKYMVHRPFVYKALHFPEQMTQADAEGAAECLKVFT